MSRPIHFEILVDEPERVAAFYREVFGWEVATWDGPQEYWPAQTGARDVPGIDGAFMHRHFEQPVINTIPVESLDDALAKVDAAGGEMIHGPNEVPGVGMHAYCQDPAGVIFGVLEPAARTEDGAE